MKKILLVVFVLLIVQGSAFAKMRLPHSTTEVIDRSELIAIARIQVGSVEYALLDEAGSYEYRALLIIKEILKGKSSKTELPIIIHGWLIPVVGGYEKRANRMINLRGDRKDYPKDIIEIIGGKDSIEPLVEDAGKNNLWFLRKISGRLRQEPSKWKYGIADPEDLRPLELTSVVKAYIEKDGDALCEELSAKSKLSAACAAEILGNMKYKPAAPLLRDIAKQIPEKGTPDIRTNAIRALENFHSNETKYTLIEIIESFASDRILAYAADVLSEYIEYDAIDTIRLLIESSKYKSFDEYLPETLKEMESKMRKVERSQELKEQLELQGADTISKSLKKEDIEALTYMKEKALSEAVLKYCFHEFGNDLLGYKKDMETFRAVMSYFEIVKHEPAALPLAKAVVTMKSGSYYYAIEPLVKVLKATCDKDDPTILPVLLSGFEKNPICTDGPVHALEAIGGEEAVLVLIKRMKSIEKDAKYFICRMIIRIIKPEYTEAIKQLKKIIENGKGENKYYAMKIVWEYPNRYLNEAFLKMAKDKDEELQVKVEAIRYIGKRKMYAARTRIETLGRENKSLRGAVADALKYIGTKESLPLLASFLKEEEQGVNICAAQAIGSIIGKKFAPDEEGDKAVKAAVQWWDEHKSEFNQ